MRVFSRFRPGLALACVVAASVPASAQTLPLRTISKMELEYAEPFTCISGLRELSNGRVVVSDTREKTLRIIDLRTGTATNIGREGQGPAEWATPSALFAATGDTTLLWDQGNRRFLPIHPDGSTGKAFAPNFSTGASGRGGPGAMLITAPRGVDRLGRVYLPGGDFARDADGRLVAADSTAILRYDPRNASLDTLGFLKIPKVDIDQRSAGGNTTIMIMAPNPMLPQATWTVTADGRVAIVQPEPYHVEWLSTSKAKTVGPDVRYQPLPVAQADKDAVPAVNNCATMIVTGGRGGGEGQVRANVAAGAAAEAGRVRAAARDDWPATKPPFFGGGRIGGNVISAPNGEVWVLRTRPAGDDVPTYDIFDARGQATGRVALPKKTRFVAFGNGTIYLSRMDEDDLVYLQRYRLDAVR